MRNRTSAGLGGGRIVQSLLGPGIAAGGDRSAWIGQPRDGAAGPDRQGRSAGRQDRTDVLRVDDRGDQSLLRWRLYAELIQNRIFQDTPASPRGARGARGATTGATQQARRLSRRHPPPNYLFTGPS